MLDFLKNKISTRQKLTGKIPRKVILQIIKEKRITKLEASADNIDKIEL